MLPNLMVMHALAPGGWMWIRLCLAALLLRGSVAPVPCPPALSVDVELGGQVRKVGVSATILHGDYELRDCALVSVRYEGTIYLGCDEGTLNVSIDLCTPRTCPTYSSISVTLGGRTTTVMPREPIQSGGTQIWLCRYVNPVYRGSFPLFCSFGWLSVDTSACAALWVRLPDPEWTPRSMHAAVALEDSAVLLLGGRSPIGLVQDVWQWSPRPPPVYGVWEEDRIPPWTGRAGMAAVQQHLVDGEQVVLLGGNDGKDRSDVWRWLRHGALVPLDLEDSDARGTQRQDCTINDEASLVCAAVAGVSGREWTIQRDLPLSSEVHVEMRRSGGSGESGASVLVAVLLDDCRLVFQSTAGSWSSAGCSGDWLAPAGYIPGAVAGETLGPWEYVRVVLDKKGLEVTLIVDGQVVARETEFALPAGKTQVRCFEGSVGATCTRGATVQEMMLHTVEVVVWPRATIEVRRVSLLAPPGHWQLLASRAPWAPRSHHAVVSLPNGDLILMGGISEGVLLRDVWRWTVRRCTYGGLDEITAATVELNCSGVPCEHSFPHGQWRRLEDAPWEARWGHAAVVTPDGVLMSAGHTMDGFKSDIWRWSFPSDEDDPCSSAWEGMWTELSANAPFSPRYGHRMVYFDPDLLNGQGAGTTLIFGGYGGDPIPDTVQREPQARPIQYHSDIWCATRSRLNFSTWSEISPEAPFSPRTLAGVVVTPSIADFTILMLGGYDSNEQDRRDLWWWTGENATAECVDPESFEPQHWRQTADFF